MRTLLMAGVLMLGSAEAARATVIETIEQVGPNVVITGTGTLNTAALGPAGFANLAPAEIAPAYDTIVNGPVAVSPNLVFVVSVTGPASFGSGLPLAADSGSGDHFDFSDTNGVLRLGVPTYYVSGATLSASSTYDNATFASLGITPGTYNFAIEDAGNTVVDTFIIQAGPVSVPEPDTLTLVGGLIGLSAAWVGAAGLRRRMFGDVNVGRKGRSLLACL